jgi:hypothetical protein
VALLTVKKTGKASEAATFTPEEAAGTTSEIVVPTGLELKIESTLTAVSISCEGNAKLSATKNASFTGTKPITMTGETTVTLTSVGALRCTGAGGTTQEIQTGGCDLKILNLNGSGTTKYKLLDALTASTELSLKAGLLTTGNFNVTVPKIVFESATAKELILGSSTLKITGTGTVWSDNTFALGVKGETSTIECTGTTVTFASVNTGFNVITFTGKTITLEAATAMKAVTINFSLTGAEREVRFLSEGSYEATTFTKSSGIQKWVATTSGTAFKLRKASGNVSLEELELKDSKGEVVTWTDLNGTDLGGNTGWTFETTGGTTGHVVGVV